MGSAAMTSAMTARVHHTDRTSIARSAPMAASPSGNSAGVADGEAAPARRNGGAVWLMLVFDPLRTFRRRFKLDP